MVYKWSFYLMERLIHKLQFQNNIKMLQKGQPLYSVIFHKCPRCHTGKLWKKIIIQYIPNLTKGDFAMYEDCSHCGLNYEREPGFWWGAMYIGYAFSSGALLITSLICLVGFQMEVTPTMIVVLIVAAIGFFFNARLARAAWIAINVKFDKKYLNK